MDIGESNAFENESNQLFLISFFPQRHLIKLNFGNIET